MRNAGIARVIRYRSDAFRRQQLEQQVVGAHAERHDVPGRRIGCRAAGLGDQQCRAQAQHQPRRFTASVHPNFKGQPNLLKSGARRSENAVKASLNSADLSCRTKCPDSWLMCANKTASSRIRDLVETTDAGARAAMAAAVARATECKSALGTARFAMPQLTAFSALTGSPKTNISNARACPMRSGISMLEPASGTSARLTNGVIRNASSATYTMSQCRSIVTPTPTARPLTAATIAVRPLASAGRSGLASSGLGAAVELPIAAKSARSFPAVNISPLALIKMQRTLGSPSAFAISVASVFYMRSEDHTSELHSPDHI